MYVEACESGSIFEGIMPKDLNIYVTTASNAQESSYGTYCPGMNPSPPTEYITCLGDLYSVAWMEDRYIYYIHFIMKYFYVRIYIFVYLLWFVCSETHNLKKETVKQQYQTVHEILVSTRLVNCWFENAKLYSGSFIPVCRWRCGHQTTIPIPKAPMWWNTVTTVLSRRGFIYTKVSIQTLLISLLTSYQWSHLWELLTNATQTFCSFGTWYWSFLFCLFLVL